MAAAGNNNTILTVDILKLNTSVVASSMQKNEMIVKNEKLNEICDLAVVQNLYSKTKTNFHSVRYAANANSIPFHLCFKILLSDQIVPRMKNLLDKLKDGLSGKEIALLNISLDGHSKNHGFKQTLVSKFIISSLELRNNRGRDGSTISTHSRANPMVKVIEPRVLLTMSLDQQIFY